MSMSGFGKRVDVPGGRRRSARQKVRMIGSAQSLQGSKSIIVEDIGPKGAKVTGRQLPEPGKEVLLRAGELDVFGRIAWADRDQRGVIFDEPVD
jgi:hypothetical protein